MKVAMFNNRAKNENNAMHEANAWLTANADFVEVISMDTCASMAATGEHGGCSMFYITILYREKNGGNESNG